MAWTKTKTAIVAGIGIFLVGGATVLILNEKVRIEKARLEYQKDPVAYIIRHQRPDQNDDEVRNELVGTWELAGTKSWGAPKFTYAPTNIYYFKIFTLTNFSVVRYDSDSNLVWSMNGPYTLRGEVYSESIQSATGAVAKFRGAHPRFNIRVMGDRYYQKGINNRPPIEEVWRRIN